MSKDSLFQGVLCSSEYTFVYAPLLLTLILDLWKLFGFWIILANVKIYCLKVKNWNIYTCRDLAMVPSWHFHLNVLHPQTQQVQNCAYFAPKLHLHNYPNQKSERLHWLLPFLQYSYPINYHVLYVTSKYILNLFTSLSPLPPLYTSFLQ